jgi:hypothetical protein
MDGPSAEFADQERLELLQRFEAWWGLQVPIEFWACAWLGDLQKLRDLVDNIENINEGVAWLLKRGTLSSEVIRPCMWVDLTPSMCLF